MGFIPEQNNLAKTNDKYSYQIKRVDNWIKNTLKRDPMDENLDDLEDSSAGGGNRAATKEHFEAVNRSWCSATT